VELKLQTQNFLQVTLSKKDLGVSGLKLSVGGTQDLSKVKMQRTINVGAEFQHDNIFFKVVGGLPLEGGDLSLPLYGNFVIQPVDNFFFGAKYDLKVGTGGKGTTGNNVEFKVAGSRGDTRGFVTGTLDNRLALFLNHSFNLNDCLGVRITADPPTEEKKTTILALDIAGHHRVSRETVVHSKLNITPDTHEKGGKPGIRFGIGFSQTLPGTFCVATFASDINVGEFMGGSGGEPHSLGFELKLR
jgi:hypothetical protein